VAHDAAKPNLLIACGALAQEIVALQRLNHWEGRLEVTCLPAIWHNTPDKIPEGVRQKIKAGKAKYDRIFVAYGDCGTGGMLDEVLKEEGAERIEGPHCYEFYSGAAVYEALQEEEVGTFYLTDFLARQFETLVIVGLGLDRHPELLPLYFGNYTRLVYLAQTDDPELTRRAEAAAARLGLRFERIRTGYGELAAPIQALARPA